MMSASSDQKHDNIVAHTEEQFFLTLPSHPLINHRPRPPPPPSV